MFLIIFITCFSSIAQETKEDTNINTINDTVNKDTTSTSLLDSILLNDTNTVYELFVKANKNFIKEQYDKAFELYNLVLKKDSLKKVLPIPL
jgi:ATP-dependent Clp protease adapter protein ClpS